MDATGFVDDGKQWWAVTSGPTLTGTVSSPTATLQVYIAGQPVGPAATVADGAWTIALPTGTLTADGQVLEIRLTDGTATPASLTQRFALASATVVSLNGSKVADERSDSIAFSPEPIHTHASASIDLGGTGCPDVYFYPYLLDQSAPPFGGENAPNPFGWKIQAQAAAGIDDTQSAYRVRTGDGVLQLDWTALGAGTDGDYALALHRNGDHGVPALNTYAGKLFVDVRFHDKLGQETITTSCVTYHPLAAPLEIPFTTDESGATALWGMSFAAGSPIADLLTTPTVPTYGNTFIQHTAEPVSLSITLPAPAASYSKVVTRRAVKVATGVVSCGTIDEPVEANGCNKNGSYADVNTPSSGPVNSNIWTLVVNDEATGAPFAGCAINGLHADCQIPPRAIGAAAHAYRFVLSVSNVAELWPDMAGGNAQQSLLGRTFTGTIDPTNQFHCDNQNKTPTGVLTCAYSEYTNITALDQATLTFGGVTPTYSASVGGDIPETEIFYEPLGQAGSVTWNAGTAVLPGS